MSKQAIDLSIYCPICEADTLQIVKCPGGKRADKIAFCNSCGFSMVHRVKEHTIVVEEHDLTDIFGTTVRVRDTLERDILKLQRSIKEQQAEIAGLVAKGTRLENELLAERISKTQDGIDMHKGGER